MTEYRSGYPRETRSSKEEILEFGWQERLRDAINREGTAEEEISRMKRMIVDAQETTGILIADGALLRDTILMAEAWREIVEDRNMKVRRDASVVGQSVDSTIALAYGIQAVADPHNDLGHYIGYATGQGQEKAADARMVATTAGSLSRHILNNRIRKEDLGAVIVDGAESGSVYNDLLLSGLKELRDRGAAPLIILLSKHPERTQKIAEFFDTGIESLHTLPVEEAGDELPAVQKLDLSLPDHILYEPGEKPYHIDQTGRASDILTHILRGHIHAGSTVLLFAQNEGMSKEIMQHVRRELRNEFISSSAPDTAETDTHTIQLLSRNVPLDKRLALELDAQDVHERYSAKIKKPTIIISSIPADMLGITRQFDVVIDTHRSRQGGGYSSISRHEADRRASYATPDGTCYRLTTESEYDRPEHLDSESTDTFLLSQEKEDEFDDAVRAAGKDPGSFPHIFKRQQRQQGWGLPHRESGRIEPPIERWVKQLGVEPHIARLVEGYEKQGRLDTGLAIAACVREGRILEERASPYLLAQYYGIPCSDILLRTRIWADHLHPQPRPWDSNVYGQRIDMKRDVNARSLEHLQAMYDRWARQLRIKSDRVSLAGMLRELDNDALTRMLVDAMPERLAYVRNVDLGYYEPEYVDSNTGNQYMKLGRSSVVGSERNWFLFPLSTTGRDNTIITTAHPLTLERAVRYFPDTVHLDVKNSYRDASTGAVMQEREITVNMRSTRGKDFWKEIGTDAIEVTGAAAENFLHAERERTEAARLAEEDRVANLERLKMTAAPRIELLRGVLEQIIHHAKVGPSRTSAEERLRQIQKIHDELIEGTLRDPSAADTRINEHKLKIITLSRKAAKEHGWSEDWIVALQAALDHLPQAIAKHTFCQAVIADGTPAGEIEKRAHAYILSQGILMAQKGQEVDLEKIIDAVLDDIVR